MRIIGKLRNPGKIWGIMDAFCTRNHIGHSKINATDTDKLDWWKRHELVRTDQKRVRHVSSSAATESISLSRTSTLTRDTSTAMLE